MPVTQDPEIEEMLRQLQVDSLRRLAERLLNELDEVKLAQSGCGDRDRETGRI